MITDEQWFSTNTKTRTVPLSLYWTCLFGLKSWVQLDYSDRENWKYNVGCLKGLDFRLSIEGVCRSIDDSAHWKIRFQREDDMGDELKGKRRRREIGEIINANLAAHPPTEQEKEAAIVASALEAYRQGYLLFGVAPDLSPQKAGVVMEKAYSQAKKEYGSPERRARWQDWLPLICEFEDAEVKDQLYSELFNRYRRAIDGISFE